MALTITAARADIGSRMPPDRLRQEAIFHFAFRRLRHISSKVDIALRPVNHFIIATTSNAYLKRWLSRQNRPSVLRLIYAPDTHNLRCARIEFRDHDLSINQCARS